MRRRNKVLGIGGLLVAAAIVLGVTVLPDYLIRYSFNRMAETLPPGAAFTFERAHFSILESKMTIEGLRMHWTIIAPVPAGEKPDGFSIAVDSLEVEKPSYGAALAFAKVAFAPESITPETRVDIAEAMMLRGIRLSVDNTIIGTTTESLRLGGLSFYPSVLLHEGRSAVEKLRTRKSRPPSSEEAHPFVPISAVMVLGIRYDTYNERNLRFTLPLAGTDPSHPVPLVLFTPALKSTYKHGIQTNGLLDGLTVEGPRPGKIVIRRVDLPDFDIRDMMARVIGGEALGAASERMPIGTIKFVDVSLEPAGQPPLPIGSWSISDLRFEKGSMMSGALSLEPTQFLLPEVSQSLNAPWLKALGLDAVTGSLRLALKRATAEGGAIVDTKLEASGLATGSMQATLTPQGAIDKATLRYDDASLVRRFLDMKVAPEERAVGALRDSLMAIAQGSNTVVTDESPQMAAVNRALAEFLRTPRSLLVELKPQPPVSFDELPAALSKPDSAGKTLGLVVTANPPN